jgi:hypothetical protein
MGDGFAVPFHRKQEGCMPHHKRLYFWNSRSKTPKKHWQKY